MTLSRVGNLYLLDRESPLTHRQHQIDQIGHGSHVLPSRGPSNTVECATALFAHEDELIGPPEELDDG